MAIILAFNVLVARKTEIDEKYPGGGSQFRSDWLKKKWWCEDEHLIAFSAMGPYLNEVAEQLKSLRVDILQTNESVPPAEIVARCGWLDWDVHGRRERRDAKGEVCFIQEIPKHWLKGSAPGDVAPWSFQKKASPKAPSPVDLPNDRPA
jgi:hypothetical protein